MMKCFEINVIVLCIQLLCIVITVHFKLCNYCITHLSCESIIIFHF